MYTYTTPAINTPAFLKNKIIKLVKNSTNIVTNLKLKYFAENKKYKSIYYTINY